MPAKDQFCFSICGAEWSCASAGADRPRASVRATRMVLVLIMVTLSSSRVRFAENALGNAGGERQGLFDPRQHWKHHEEMDEVVRRADFGEEGIDALRRLRAQIGQPDEVDHEQQVEPFEHGAE